MKLRSVSHVHNSTPLFINGFTSSLHTHLRVRDCSRLQLQTTAQANVSHASGYFMDGACCAVFILSLLRTAIFQHQCSTSLVTSHGLWSANHKHEHHRHRPHHTLHRHQSARLPRLCMETQCCLFFSSTIKIIEIRTGGILATQNHLAIPKVTSPTSD
jgi:hypothetical protein